MDELTRMQWEEMLDEELAYDNDDSFWDVYQKEVTDAAREECTLAGMI